MSIDGGTSEKMFMPTKFVTRKHEIGWKHNLTGGSHKVKFVWKNLSKRYGIGVEDLIVYSSK